MLPWWLKGSKDSVFGYKTTNAMPFLSGLEELSISHFPSAQQVLLVQSTFDFPNELFHECFSKNQAKCKMQVSGWIL